MGVGDSFWMWPDPRNGTIATDVPGVVPFGGKWMVWPKAPFFTHLIEVQACLTEEFYDTKEAAMAACRLIYG